MKLHLPKGLMVALLGVFGASSLSALTIGANLISTTVTDLSQNYTDEAHGISYVAESGIVTGINTSNFTFTVNNNALANCTTAAQLAVMTTTDSRKWGFHATNQGDITGDYLGNAWPNGGTIQQSQLAVLAESGTLTLTAKVNSTGTTLWNGDTAIGTPIYNADGLKESSKTPASLTFNKDYVTSFSYKYEGTGASATNTDNTWRKDYATVSRDAVSNDKVDATLATGNRLQINGGSGNHTTVSEKGGDIVVGGAGQLFLQTWNTGAIELNNDIYLGSSTHGDVGTYGVLRVGSDGNNGTINLNGKLVLVENSSMATSTGNSAKAVNVNGAVEGNYTLTVKNASNLHFKGGMNIGKLELNNSSAVDLGATGVSSTLHGLTMAAGSSLTNNGSLLLDGTIVLGCNGIVNNGEVTFSSDTIFDLSNLTANAEGIYTLFTGTDVDLLGTYDFTAENIIGVEGKDTMQWTFNSNGTIKGINPAAYYWAGTDDAWLIGGSTGWTFGSSSTPCGFESGDVDVIFGPSTGSGFNKNVAIGTALQAGHVSIQDDYTFTMTEGANLTADEISVQASKTLSLTGTGTVAANISGTGRISVGEGSTLDLGTLENVSSLVISGGTVLTGDATQAVNLIMDVTGESGVLKLEGTGMTVTIPGKANYTSHFKGMLDVGANTLLIGTGIGGQEGNEPQLKTFSAIRLAGGTVSLTGWGCDSTQSKLLVEETAGTLTVKQHGNSSGRFHVAEAALKADLNIQTAGSKANLNLDVLSGSETLIVKGDTTGDNTVDLVVSDMSAFTGNIDITPTRGSAQVNVHMNTGAGDVAMGNLTVKKKSSVEMAATDDHSYTVGDISVSGANAHLNVTASLVATGSISVTDSASLTLATAALSSTITSGGTVTFTQDITTTGLDVQGGETVKIGLDSQETTGDNYFAGATAASYITVVNGGTVVGNSVTVTQAGIEYTMQDNGTATAAGKGADFTKFFLGSAEVSVSEIADVSTAHSQTLSTVEMTGGALSVNQDVANVTAKGGVISMDGGNVTTKLEVAENTTVNGVIDAEKITIDAGKTATLESGVQTSGVIIGGNSGATVENTGSNNEAYNLGNANAKVTAESLTSTSNDEVTVGNQLVVDSVINNGSGELNLTGAVTANEIAATNGAITLMNQGATQKELASLSIGDNQAVSVYQGASGTEGIIKLADNGTITVGTGSTLNSDLVIGNNVTLDFAEALTLGSTLTVGEGVVLGTELMEALNNLEDGGTLTLVQAKDASTLNYGGTYGGVAANLHFNTANWADGFEYTIQADGTTFGITKNVPEPTTGTLGLLALAGLMARRRRK